LTKKPDGRSGSAGAVLVLEEEVREGIGKDGPDVELARNTQELGLPEAVVERERTVVGPIAVDQAIDVHVAEQVLDFPPVPQREGL
jgi:hypothetical protein